MKSVFEIRFYKLPFDFGKLFSDMVFDLVDGFYESADFLDISGSNLETDQHFAVTGLQSQKPEDSAVRDVIAHQGFDVGAIIFTGRLTDDQRLDFPRQQIASPTSRQPIRIEP